MKKLLFSDETLDLMLEPLLDSAGIPQWEYSNKLSELGFESITENGKFTLDFENYLNHLVKLEVINIELIDFSQCPQVGVLEKVWVISTSLTRSDKRYFKNFDI